MKRIAAALTLLLPLLILSLSACTEDKKPSNAETKATPESWIADANGCKAHNSNPESGETITWSGACKDGYLSGQGVLKWLKDGKPNGTGEGNFERGKMQGQGSFTFASGSRFVGNWHKGKLRGNGTYTFTNGNRYEGEFSDGERSGTGTFTWADGSRYVGEWKAGKRHGRGTLTYADGTQTSGEWRENQYGSQPQNVVSNKNPNEELDKIYAVGFDMFYAEEANKRSGKQETRISAAFSKALKDRVLTKVAVLDPDREYGQ